MKTILLSAAAALVLTSTYSVSSFAQHDDEDAYRAPDGGGYRMHYRGDNDERSEDRQDNGTYGSRTRPMARHGLIDAQGRWRTVPV